MEYARACPNIKEIPILDAVQNASLTMTVQEIKLALEISALILVQELVAKMQFVMFQTIFQCVLVQPAWLEMHLFDALLINVCILRICFLFDHLVTLTKHS